MTDVDAPPIGTKRRGSMEMKTEELQLPPDQLAANLSVSDEEPLPSSDIETSAASKTSESETVSNTKKKAISFEETNVPKTGHRRRNTDGNLNINRSKFFKAATSKQVINLMQSELPATARADMQNKANYLKLERELKHSQIKLREAEDQCHTAVEIIGNLQRENEDLVVREEMLRTQLGAVQTELKISEQKVQSLEELYRSDTAKYKQDIDSTKKQLNDLQFDMNQKDIQLNQAKEYQQSMQQQISVSIGDNEDDENRQNVNKTKREKQLNAKIEDLQKQLIEKDGKIETLLFEVEKSNRTKYEKEDLQKEINSLNAMAQQDILFQKEQMEKMTREIIMLGSRNSALEKERDDLMTLLEERDYENQMLKTGYGLHRNKTNRTNHEMGIYADELEDEVEYDETLENLAFMDQSSYRAEDMDDVMEESEEYENMQSRDSISASPKHKKKPAPQKEVVDVIREYLHLTASVVNMKFPRIQHISSDELINKVKNYQFFEYHDMMVRIMKTEEQKMVAKQKAEQEAKQNNQGQQAQTGMLSRFRNFFGGGGAANNNNQNDRGRASMAMASSSSKAAKTRTRGNTTGSVGRQRSATLDKKAPTAPNRLNKAKDAVHKFGNKAKDVKERIDVNKVKASVTKIGNKAKDVKDSTVKKITGNPTDQEQKALADMSFGSVPFVGAPKDDEVDNGKNVKPEKPAQKL